MLYSRVVIKDEKLKMKLKGEFDFYDLIYINKLGKSITEDTLKIRVYNKTDLNIKKGSNI